MEDTKKELTMSRTLDAPLDLVYKAWTDPELVKQWWGPNGVSNRVNAWDAEPNGKIDLVMIAGTELGPLAGQEWPMAGEFEELDEPDKIVFTANALVDGTEVLKHRTTVMLKEQNGKTEMTVHVVVIKTTPEAAGPLAGMEQGWNQQLDKLVEFVEKK